MRIAWLLFTRSGRSNWNRLGLTATAVALGMLMLLVFIAGINALESRMQHGTWRHELLLEKDNQKPVDGVAPLLVSAGGSGNLNKWRNEDIAVTSIRATGVNSPRIAGLQTPKEGEYYVSHGLAEVMREHPQDDVGTRFGEKQLGVLPEHLSPSPDSLEVIRGMSESELEGAATISVYSLSASAGKSAFSGEIGVVLVFGAVILLFPIVMFIAVATQLGSAQREKRYAAMRLIGATRRQVMQVIAFESLIAAVIGIVGGTVLYLALLPLMARYEFSGMRFWQSDLMVPLGYYAMAVGLMLVFCLVANWWGMRQVQLSPLGVARSSKLGKKPRVGRLVLFVPGIAVFVWLTLPKGEEWLRDQAADSVVPLLVLVAGVMSVMFGLLLAGPWLTNAFSRMIAWRTRSATKLLASKRIAVRSRQIFRSVSGVVLALFAGSFYLTGVSGVAQLNTDALRENGYSQLKNDVTVIAADDTAPGFVGKLRAQPYVQAVSAVEYSDDAGIALGCSELAAYTRHTCPPGSQPTDNVVLNFDAPMVNSVTPGSTLPAVTGERFLVKLDSNQHIDQLRTFVAGNTAPGSAALVVSGTYAQIPQISPIVSDLANLAYAGMAVTLFVAVASLIVATIGGLLERKRSFAALRLGGMTTSQMKRTVMIESLIPLISVSVLACALGIWVGAVFMSAMSDSAKPIITPLYVGIVVGSLVVAVLAIRAVVPMLEKMTRPEENRTE